MPIAAPAESFEAEPPKPAEKPDAVLAGLARLRALAAQFTVPAAAPAAEIAPDPQAADVVAVRDAEGEVAPAPAPSSADNNDVAADALAEPVPATEPAAVATPEMDAVTESTPVTVPQRKPKARPKREAEPEPRADPAAEPALEQEPEPQSDQEPELAGNAVVAVRPTLSHQLEATSTDIVLKVRGLSKGFGDTVAVNDIHLNVRAGVFYGIVGPNGAGKTTTLSMITGLLRPDSGTASVNGIDVWDSPEIAKRSIGVLPDRLRIFDRLTGSQLLYYSGVLRGLKAAEVRKRSADLATAFGLDDVMGRLVSDYSSGMLKKVALAAAMIHSPRLLVLDEPFESVDPVSATTVTRILKQYVNAGGTVLLSSHRMEIVQRVCSHVAVIVEGTLLADGTIDEVRNGMSLEDRFVQLTGKNSSGGGLEWLSSFSD
ncbi:hypothetical protein GCM10009655_02050 [Rhodoglobus aureus]|uniref:ABC transporter domain-containing protein n=2 Tax=Rhodoglobus aureus TaxID=191497 RepID=A0ABN1VDC8_9MICO